MGGKRTRTGEYIHFCSASMIFLGVSKSDIRGGNVRSKDPIGG